MIPSNNSICQFCTMWQVFLRSITYWNVYSQNVGQEVRLLLSRIFIVNNCLISRSPSLHCQRKVGKKCQKIYESPPPWGARIALNLSYKNTKFCFWSGKAESFCPCSHLSFKNISKKCSVDLVTTTTGQHH